VRLQSRLPRKRNAVVRCRRNITGRLR
jgi:hypothetical protein